MSAPSKPVYVDFLNGPDIAALALSDAEILAAIEGSLGAQGRGESVIEPRMHLEPRVANGHFNVLRGYVGAPVERAGVKIVGDFVDNWERGLPSEMAILYLADPRTGMPQAILDAAGITDMRTGAVTAIGARHLARRDSKVLAHIGARGTAYWNVRLLAHLFAFDEIRVHSRRPESRAAFARRLEQDLGRPIVVTEDWESCVRGADIVVEASRLSQPTPMLRAVLLRIHPVVPLVPRILEQDFELGGWLIPKGSAIGVSVMLLHQNPDIYPNPTEFIPERFLGKTFSPFDYAPFGGGARRCIGAAFATFEAKLVLVEWLRAGTYSLVDTARPRLERRNITLAPRGGVMMRRDSSR